ncbi:DMT family transporter, partial [Klebsiella pneumoniae]
GMVGSSVFLPFVWITPTDPFIIALMLLTGFLGGAGHLLLTLAFGLAPPSLLQPFLFSQLVLSTGAGWLFFGTVPDAVSLAGISVIGAAGLYVWYRE